MAHIVEVRVGEQTTVEGATDPINLGGALTAHIAFAAKCSIGDTLFYDCAAVDASGAETGEWEEGLGTYASGNTITRTTVTRSSNADNAVAFAAGTKYVRIVAERRQVAAVPRGGTAGQVVTKVDGTDYNNQWGGDVNIGDSKISRAMLIDCGATYLDKGNSGTTTQTIDYTAGSHQKITCTGNFTLAVSNLPPTGNLGAILLEAVNFGANTVTWPTASFVKPDGSYTSSVSTWLAAWTGRTAFQSSGTDWIKIWSRDASTLIVAWAA